MARPQKAKPKKFEKLSDRLAKAAKSPVKKIAKASAVIKKKVAKKTKAALGLGKAAKRTREATKGDIRRKGISLLKRNNASLARFIALRYGAKAIAKYQDYAGRLRRSIRLRKQVVKIDDATFRIKGYIIRTDTAGNNPYSCTCPDFSQFSNDDRNWLSSKAGPFNPCKHMMAVRDRDKASKWKCSNGVCVQDPTGIYLSKSECESKLSISQMPLGTGQCVTLYNIKGYVLDEYRYRETHTPSDPWKFGGAIYFDQYLKGPLNIWIVNNNNPPAGPPTEAYLKGANPDGTPFLQSIAITEQFEFTQRRLSIVWYSGSPVRLDGLPDDCGNAPNVCP